jgi:hypothetical protein
MRNVVCMCCKLECPQDTIITMVQFGIEVNLLIRHSSAGTIITMQRYHNEPYFFLKPEF